MIKADTFFLLHSYGEKVGCVCDFFQWKAVLGKVGKEHLQVQVFGYFQAADHEDLLADGLFL